MVSPDTRLQTYHQFSFLADSHFFSLNLWSYLKLSETFWRFLLWELFRGVWTVDWKICFKLILHVRWKKNCTLRNFLLLVIHSLRDVRVLVPEAVKRYDTVELNCHYDLEGDSLYSVKWYKGRREFYRYTPKENPAMKIFPIGGATVVV